MPKVSVIIPLYNAEDFIEETLRSVLQQTYSDFEIVIVNDGSTDRSLEACRKINDSRIRIIQQSNRGLAGARNTGIRSSTGEYLALLDADDLWAPTKLETHVAFLDQHPEVGISFDYSEFINAEGQSLGLFQKPKKLRGITPDYILCRNPIGNGSAPVLRRQLCDALSYSDARSTELCIFDEHLPTRQAEDVELWLRAALTTPWKIEGIAQVLTYYRLSNGGLSANVLRQLKALEDVIEKARTYAPEVIANCDRRAHAYHLRYTARRMVTLRNGKLAVDLMHRALRSSWRIVLEEPGKTLLTAIAAYALRDFPLHLYQWLEQMALSKLTTQSLSASLSSRTASLSSRT